ncbi:MAG: carboxyltransferase domain-containing protein [Actinomycetota bacterium]
MRIERLGRDSLRVSDLADPAGWANVLRPTVAESTHDVVPGESDVVVIARPGRIDDVAKLVADLPSDRVTNPGHVGNEPAAADVTIPVAMDGPDLDEVAEHTGLTTEEVVARILDVPLRVAFCGFSPGFSYLTGLPDELHLARRASPRREVAAGSLAIAAGYAAVYPSPSPGGWHLLGSTDVAVWDVDRDPPALLAPGTIVRFTSP